MAIYDIKQVESKKVEEAPLSNKDRFFSGAVTRALFLFLLLATTIWIGYALVASVLQLLTWNKWPLLQYSYRSLKRALVSQLALLLGLFSPPFGILVACTYFLMYDKEGIHDVVPRSIQEQFKDFFDTE